MSTRDQAWDDINRGLGAIRRAEASRAAHSVRQGHAVMARVRADAGGFLTEGDLAAIARDAETRLQPVLVRCQGGRFTCPAQDAAHFIAIIEQSASLLGARHSDSLRDVSLPAGAA